MSQFPAVLGKVARLVETSIILLLGSKRLSEAACQPIRCFAMNMNVKILACLSFAALFCALVGDRAQAQSGASSFEMNRIKNRHNTSQFSSQSFQNRARSVRGFGAGGVNRRHYGGGSSSPRRSKPFSSINRGPAVSPYLALSGSLNGVSDYYNIVRPQQEQARVNRTQQRQILSNQNRLNQISAVNPFDLRGDANLAPTGHSATYMLFNNFQSTGNFFPPMQGLNRRRQ